MAGASSLTGWALALAQPLVSRVIIALGFQLVTITGVTAALDGLKSTYWGYLGGVSSSGLQLALLGGTGTAMAMIFGAIAFRLSLWTILNATKYLGKAG